MFCKQCGAEVAPESIKCETCNTKVGKGQRFCPHCGAQRHTTDDICSACHQSFSASKVTEPRVEEVHEPSNPPAPEIQKAPDPPAAPEVPASLPKKESAAEQAADTVRCQIDNPLIQKLIAKDKMRESEINRMVMHMSPNEKTQQMVDRLQDTQAPFAKPQSDKQKRVVLDSSQTPSEPAKKDAKCPAPTVPKIKNKEKESNPEPERKRPNVESLFPNGFHKGKPEPADQIQKERPAIKKDDVVNPIKPVLITPQKDNKLAECFGLAGFGISIASCCASGSLLWALFIPMAVFGVLFSVIGLFSNNRKYGIAGLLVSVTAVISKLAASLLIKMFATALTSAVLG